MINYNYKSYTGLRNYWMNDTLMLIHSRIYNEFIRVHSACTYFIFYTSCFTSYVENLMFIILRIFNISWSMFVEFFLEFGGGRVLRSTIHVYEIDWVSSI